MWKSLYYNVILNTEFSNFPKVTSFVLICYTAFYINPHPHVLLRIDSADTLYWVGKLPKKHKQVYKFLVFAHVSPKAQHRPRFGGIRSREIIYAIGHLVIVSMLGKANFRSIVSTQVVF